MGELINGRTPEEIITGLKCEVPCHKCAYKDHNFMKDDSCSYYVEQDIIALIRYLESERDAALEKVPKWISVKDSKKPRHGQECFCVCTMPDDPKHEWDYLMVLKWYAYGSNGLVDRPHFQHEGYEGMTVSHWMPTHKLPKEEPNA